MRLAGTLAATAALGLALTGGAAAQDDVRIAMVVKALGIGFFEAARDGGLEAAEEVGDIELIYTGPTTTTAEGQIETISSLIAQRVDAIAVSANDTDALVPILQRAMDRGITVISWDSGVAPEGRLANLNPSGVELIGRKLAELAAEPIDGEGKIAILSTTPTMTNQNQWIAAMQEALPDFPGLELVTTVYGDDLADKSYRETVALMQAHPDVEVIVAPTSIGIVAAAQAVADQDRIGEVWVTGLGLPSELAGHVDSGAVQSFAIWNPIDLGYSATMLAYNLATGKAEAGPGATIPIGRMGSITLDDNGEAAMADPFTYDASNVHDFADIF